MAEAEATCWLIPATCPLGAGGPVGGRLRGVGVCPSGVAGRPAVPSAPASSSPTGAVSSEDQATWCS